MKNLLLQNAKLHQKIISLETRNNLLQLNNRQLEELRKRQSRQEEIDILKSQLKYAQEDLASANKYIEHLEELLNFFVYKKNKFKYTQHENKKH